MRELCITNFALQMCTPQAPAKTRHATRAIVHLREAGQTYSAWAMSAKRIRAFSISPAF
jgi:hypothetical protein